MLKIKNVGLDQYDAEPFEQQQFGIAGVEWVKLTGRGFSNPHGGGCLNVKNFLKCKAFMRLVVKGLKYVNILLNWQQ